MEPNVNPEMIDTTDALEAVSVMKGMKNFLFWVLLIALLISQAMVWMNRLGLIDTSDCADCPVHRQAATSCPMTLRCAAAAVVPLTAAHTVAEQAEEVTRKVGLGSEEQVEQTQETVAVERTQEAAEPREEAADEDRPMELPKLSCAMARGIVRVANFVMFMAAVLYCLTLLMNLKISLTGKLGGINHISRAFFGSLFVLVFLTPWQVVLPGVLVGAMYLPTELLCGAWAEAETSRVCAFLMLLRFTGLWVIVVWLLLCAQSRSIKWARATLRRLGMSR